MFNRIKGFFTKSAAETYRTINLSEIIDLGHAVWGQNNYQAFAREGYQKNVIAYHCISQISQALSAIPICAYINEKEIDDPKNPIRKLLKSPNYKQSYAAWMREVAMYRLIGGNSYIIASEVSAGRDSRWLLENLRPTFVTIQETSDCEPYAFNVTKSGFFRTFMIDTITGIGEYGQDDELFLLHIKEPNPTCNLYGLSPMQAASMSIGQHNESGEWNKKLLQNSGKPSGIVTVVENENSAPLTEQQYNDITKDINEKYAGNAGKIIVSAKDLKWLQMALSPTDMDWLEGKNTSARDVCLAFKYPPVLLGIPGSVSYNNMTEAKLALYEESVIPLLCDILDSLGRYLSQLTAQDITFEPDLDKVTALAPRREATNKTARENLMAGMITLNESRYQIDLDPVENGDEVMAPANKLPLSFDSPKGESEKSEFKGWLIKEGFSQENVEKMVQIAYSNEKRKSRNK
jgi:HK97 family phage portal protein